MKTQVKKHDFTGQKVYVGFDTHKKMWKVATCTVHTNPGPWTVTIKRPFVENISSYLHKHYPGADFLCAYESGFCGFWIQEEMEKQGFPTIVVNAADIPTSDKERKQKEDRRDARKIAKALKNSEVEGIYVPLKQEQIDRSVVRERYSIVKNARRIKVQIKSHLAFYGIEIPEEMADKYWSRNFINWLTKIKDERKDTTLDLQLKRLQAMRELQLQGDRALRLLSQSERHKAISELLVSVPGVGTVTAMLLKSEIVEMHRFPSFRHLCSYIGFIPTTYSSSDKEIHGNLTDRRNKRLRTALIESSWIAIKNDSELLLKYEEYRRRMDAQLAIVRIARILLRRIRRVWLSQARYQKAIM